MKLMAFIISGKKRNTCNASEKFIQDLQSSGNMECEIVGLIDYSPDFFLNASRKEIKFSFTFKEP